MWAALVLALAHLFISFDALGTIVENGGQMILSMVLLIICGLEFLITKMMDAWQRRQPWQRRDLKGIRSEEGEGAAAVFSGELSQAVLSDDVEKFPA